MPVRKSQKGKAYKKGKKTATITFNRVRTYIELFLAILALIFGVLHYKELCQVKNELEEKAEVVEAKDDSDSLMRIYERWNIAIYQDRLISALRSVFEPFAKGLKLMTQNRLNEAIVEFKQSMQEAKHRELVALYNLVGVCYHTPGTLDSALENFHTSRILAKNFNDKEGEAAALKNISEIHRTRTDSLDTTIKYYQDLLKIEQEIGNREEEARTLSNLGAIFRSKGDLKSAREYYENVRKISAEISYKRGEATALGNLGIIFQAIGNLDTALKYHEDALQINREIGNKEGEALDLVNLGLIYQEKGENDKALGHYQDASQIFTQREAQREAETKDKYGPAPR